MKWINAILVLFVIASIYLFYQNRSLTKSIEIAQNNVSAYLNIISNKQDSNYILQLKIDELENSNDRLLVKLDSVAKENKIKNTTTAITQTQVVYVTKEKEVDGKLSEILMEYKTYSDSIQYNPLTTIHYTIGEDTVNVSLNLQNTQYLYIFKKKEWKNQKSFFKRLFTLDFKKVWKYKYDIINSNDLINTSDVRIVYDNY